MRSHLFNAGILLAIVFVFYHFCRKTYLYGCRSALKKATGAQSAKRYPQWDPIYGWDVFRDSLKAFREHRMLERSQERFKATGTTTQSIVVLGRTTIMTIEPQNLKVIQSLDHKKWELGERRKTAFKPLLGDGKYSRCVFRRPFCIHDWPCIQHAIAPLGTRVIEFAAV
jgi:hypothetical protein